MTTLRGGFQRAPAAEKARLAETENTSLRHVPPIADQKSDEEGKEDTRTAYQLAVSAGESKKRRYANRRCRKCGLQYKNSKWEVYHTCNISDQCQESTQHSQLDNVGRKVWQLCSVPENLICTHFKNFEWWDESKRVPRRKCEGCEGCRNAAAKLSNMS